LQLLQRAVKYFTDRWSLERVVKCYFTARQSRENRRVKKKRGRQSLFMPVFAALAGGKVPLYRPLRAPAGGKVIYGPLEELQRAEK
jgi:hypothetical protein